mgnify:FL=1
MQSLIKENIEVIRKRIEKAAIKAGRNPSDIKLIAVTKNVEPQNIIEAIEAGVVDFGENRVQELLNKANIIEEKSDKNIKWHMIGHLQTNKVKYIVDKITMIHSLDSLKLAQEIDRKAQKLGKTIDVLIQVNIAEEVTKFGLKKYEVLDFVQMAGSLKNIKVKGLMTIAPFAENPEQVRFVFSGLRKIFIDICRKNINNIDMKYLSMGMSNDFEIAIEEGANIVRIGTAIFGKR